MQNIYYYGTKEEWNNVKNNDSKVASVKEYFYSETKPTTSGNYWHYDVDGVTPVVWGASE